MKLIPRLRRQGSAIITAVTFAFLGSGLVLAYMKRAVDDKYQMSRALDYQQAKLWADSGLDSAIMQLRTQMNRYRLVLTKAELQTALGSLTLATPTAPYQYKTPSGADAKKVTVLTEVISGLIPYGSLFGVQGKYQQVLISIGAKNSTTGVGAVVRQLVQVSNAPLMRFGVFYENDLEILPGPPMTFAGPVHSNTDLYLGGPLTFDSRLTSVGDIFARRKDTNVYYPDPKIRNNASTAVSMEHPSYGIVDSLNADWLSRAIELWDGRVRSGGHGVSEIAPPIGLNSQPHDLIERPIASGQPGYNAETESEKFANKAALRVTLKADGTLSVVDRNGVNLTSRFTKATLKKTGTYNSLDVFEKNSEGQYTFTTAGSWTASKANNFKDGRENQYLSSLDLYLDRFLLAYPELYSGSTYGALDGRGVVYVTVEQQTAHPSGHLPVVRLRNGKDLKAAGGITIASDRPVYIEGNYNTFTTRTALVAGDAVTLLSNSWQDARSSAAKSQRQAVNTTFNTVILTGNTETVPNVQYNGGLENVLRFLEVWGSTVTATFRGSIIDLWYAEVADGNWNSTYYDPPKRDWGYDSRYMTEVPPGMPIGFVYDELHWEESNWANEGWN